jgi:two-component system chemotaxis sensor kinase CheA
MNSPLAVGLRGRLVSLAMLGVVFTLLVGTVGGVLLARAAKARRALVDQDVSMSMLAERLDVRGLQLRRFEKDLFLNIATEKVRDEYEQKWEGGYTEFQHVLGDLQRLATAPEDVAELATVDGSVSVYASELRKLRARMHTGEITTPAQGNASITPFKNAIREVDEHTQALVKRSRARMEATIAQQTRVERNAMTGVALVTGLLALLGTGIGLGIARSVLRPVGEVMVALEAVARGDLTQRVAEDRSDELGRLKVALNTAVGNTRSARDAVVARTEAMRLVLDHVSQGLVTIDRDGKLSSERSAIVDTWFGAPAKDATFGEWLDTASPGFRSRFAFGWGEVLGDLMPRDVMIEQLPSRVAVGGRTYDIAYTVLEEREAVTGALLVMTDITERLERERLAREQVELVNLFQRIAQDRDGVLAFIAESMKLAEAVAADTSMVVLKRHLHTLKGNMAIYGVDSVAELCHKLEDEVSEREQPLSGDQAAALRTQVEALGGQVQALAGNGRDPGPKVTDDDLARALKLVASAAPHDQIARELLRWKLEPASLPLQRLADNARGLAERLGKGGLRVRVVDNGVRLSARKFERLWSSVVHVLRNAVDHGIEEPEERERQGKPQTGEVALEARAEGDAIRIVISDDGRGIDWEKLRESAVRRGLPAETRRDLEMAMFADGVSTRDEVTELSGRGVGMAAVLSECTALGGQIEVTSAEHRGTAIHLVFPQGAKHSMMPPPVSPPRQYAAE